MAKLLLKSLQKSGRIIFMLMAFLCLIFSDALFAQCGQSEFCNGNTGLYSNDNATDIAYDNMGSSYHASYIREPNGQWKVWGSSLLASSASALDPTNVNATNYPGLTGTIYKIGVGGNDQMVVLTSTGLFAVGYDGEVVSAAITSSGEFEKLTVNGNTNGLPIGIVPDDVKMFFVSTSTIIITTCDGRVFVLTRTAHLNGSTIGGSGTVWHQVMQDATTPLSDVIVTRGTFNMGFALKSDGTIWTWGRSTFLGDGTPTANRTFAAQMTLPAGIPGIKMIQATTGNAYYVLGTDKKIYTLGINGYGQLGDRTTNTRLSWVNAKNPDGSVITDAAWISSNEHDGLYPTFTVIKTNGHFFTAGANSFSMIARTDSANFLDFPLGITSADIITNAEAGGHSTAVIKLGSPRYGYAGHRIEGSMGDGTSESDIQQSFDFITPPIVAVCGTLCTQPTVSNNGPICPDAAAVFTITGTPGDIISYTLNNGATQTATITASGSVVLTINNATADQTLRLIYILGATGSCSNYLSTNSIVTVGNGGALLPDFVQVAPICQGDPLVALPLVSVNGIPGSWSPAINANQTTTYTFTPQNGFCSNTAQMTIVVNQRIVPSFAAVAPICIGSALNNLPLLSNEGIAGNWSPAINNTITTIYTFTPASGSCAQTTQLTVVVNPEVTPTFAQLAPACFGSATINLPAQSNEGITGSWSPPINNTATTTYTFTPDSGQCAQTAAMQVAVFEDFDFDFKSYCLNDNFMLEVVSDGLENDTRWEQNGRFVSSDNPLNVTAYLNQTTEIENLPLDFNVTLTNANQCDKTRSIAIDNIFCGIQKGISPNNDFKNDFFDLRLLNVKQLSIFNRYGTKVYGKTNYREEWHGQTDDGKILPDGVYYYVIDFDSGSSKTGWIYLNKQQ